MIERFGGDRLEVIDRFGRQPAELTVLASDPRAVTGATPDAPASVLRRLVAGPDEDGYAAGRILTLLAEHRVDQSGAVAIRLFDDTSPAGARAGFAVDDDAVVVVAAPAPPMCLSGTDPNPPSEVVVEVHRAAPSRPEGAGRR